MQEKSYPFWNFSLRVYAKPGVDLACLAMQDECGADTNILLFCCWQGSIGHALNKRFLRKVMDAVADWQHQVVQPLRQARRGIKSEVPDMPLQLSRQLRKNIATAELDAEFLEQRLLARCVAGESPAVRRARPATAIAANLQRYLELLEIPLAAGIKHHAEVLLAACRSNPAA